MAKNKKENNLRESLLLHWRAVKEVQKYCPQFFPSTILFNTLQALTPYTTIYFSAQLINELAGLRRPEVLGKWVLLTIGITFLMELLCHGCRSWKQVEHKKFRLSLDQMMTEKFFSMDFADVDKQETMDLKIQIQQSKRWAGWGILKLSNYCEDMISGVAGILGAIALTISLFTAKVPESAGVLTILNQPVFLLLLLGAMAFIIGVASKAARNANQRWADLGEEARFSNRVFGHFLDLGNRAKSHTDLRIYKQLDLAEYYSGGANSFGSDSVLGREFRGYIGVNNAFSASVPLFFTGIVYIYVCLKAWAGAFGVGSVTQYVSAVTALAANVQKVLETVGNIESNTSYLKTNYAFLDIPNAMYQGSLTTEKRRDRQYDVEFRDVSFRYPGTEHWALRHVNLKFKVGKRLAIVGENGSGKTTFIKLLCRLYDPQEGQILLNGIDIRKYNYRDYMDIFSVVFQDFQLVSQPLGNNVAGSENHDRQRVEQCLVDAGFGERLATLPEGLDTFLSKDFGKDGVLLSGGEAQKVAIARALYRDAPFIILDEPTAALDPIAEAEIYEKFDKIAGNKTAIYISHRLSSCKFCDEIVVFHRGALIQQGSHEDLLNAEGGKYHELWMAQAQYYTEEE